MNSIHCRKSVPESLLWKAYFNGEYIEKNSSPINCANQNVICSNTIFKGMTAGIAVLSGSTLALFNSVEITDCEIKGDASIIKSQCKGLAVFRCFLQGCNASSASNAISHVGNTSSEIYLELNSFVSSGTFNKICSACKYLPL